VQCHETDPPQKYDCNNSWLEKMAVQIRGSKQPNTSRLLVVEYNNLSEILEIGYVTWKYLAALLE
jgi:hypothetical protein